MVVKINSFIYIASVFLIFSSCSSNISIAKINKPAKEYYRKSLKLQSDSIMTEFGSEMGQELVDENNANITNTFDRRIAIRNRVLDSIKLLDKSLIIIDKMGNSYSGVYSESYFLYDGKCIEVYQPGHYKEEDIVKSYNQIELKEKRDDISSLASYFSANIPESNGKKIEQLEAFESFGTYNITVVKGESIRFYITSSYDINQKKDIKEFLY